MVNKKIISPFSPLPPPPSPLSLSTIPIVTKTALTLNLKANSISYLAFRYLFSTRPEPILFSPTQPYLLLQSCLLLFSFILRVLTSARVSIFFFGDSLFLELYPTSQQKF